MTPSWARHKIVFSGNSSMTKHHFTSIAVFLAIGLSTPATFASERVALRGEAAAVDVLFSSQDDIATYVVDFINKSQRRVWVAGYYFTQPDIARAIGQAKARGLDVRVILDSSQASAEKYSGATFLRNAGVPVLIHARQAIMHHKFLICDEERVGFGSANFTQAAMKKGGDPRKTNAENFNLFVGVPGLVKQYSNEFERLAAEATK
jgi:phosphatidylserine/phosphatidylglycerophosphate/cardiolipin synthase-like enzyme